METTSEDKQILSRKVLRIFIRPGYGMYLFTRRYQSIFFKLIDVKASNLVNVLSEIEESIHSLRSIRVGSLEDALAAYFAPFQAGEQTDQRVMQTL
jgi:hypothetical protein